MNDDDLRLEIKKIALRLQRLERHVGLHQPELQGDPQQEEARARTAFPDGPSLHPIEAPAPSSPPVVPARAAAPLTGGPSTSSPTISASAPPVAPAPSPPAAAPSKFTPPQLFSASPSAPPTASRPTPAARPRERSDRSLETIIGIKVLGGVGAIIVLIGAAFLAREYGTAFWIQLPALVRALVIAGFGGVLLLGGEIALRQLGKPASLGLYGAGLGILYMDAFATFQWFQIVSPDAAFLLMGLVAICGFAITLRTKFLSIGVLSLLGGFLAPLLLWREPGGMPVMAYLTMLASVGLALSAWQPRPFRPLRYVSFGGLALLGLIVVLAHVQAQATMILILITLWWTMYMAEAIYAALRRQSSLGNVVISLLSTGLYVTCAGTILQWFMPAGDHWLGGFTAMIAALGAAAALHFGPGLDGLRGRLKTAMDKLAVALWAQSAVLIALAVALQFDGYGATIGWLAMSLAAIEVGRRLPSAGVTIFGLIVMSLAILRAITIDQFVLDASLWTTNGLAIDQWAILGLAVVITLHVAAKHIGGRGEGMQLTMPVVLATLGAIGWLMLVARQADGLMLTALWLAGAVAMLAVEQFNRRERYLDISLMMLLFIAAKWLLVDGFVVRLDPAWEAAALTPVANAQMGLALVIALAGWWGLRRIEAGSRTWLSASAGEHRGAGSEFFQIAAIVGGVFFLVALSFEADRAVTAAGAAALWAVDHMRQIMFTLLWAFGSAGFGMLAMMMIRRGGTTQGSAPSSGFPLLLRFAWGVLIACAIKWLLLDTLFYTFALDRTGPYPFYPIGNVQMLAGMVIASLAMVLLWTSSRTVVAGDQHPSTAWTAARAIAPIGACVLLLWGLSFEVDRGLQRLALDPEFVTAWAGVQWLALWLSALWAGGGLLMMPLGRWRGIRDLTVAGGILIMLAAVAWLLFGALGPRMTDGPAVVPIALNIQFGIGLFLAAALIASTRLTRDAFASSESRGQFISASLALVAILAFVMGNLEIDRGWMDNVMAKQMGWSIYWALFGVALVLFGFIRLSAASRYMGLALLAITVGKVLLIDMATVEQIWRVLSFIISGLLLIATSMAYAKLTPGLLRALSDARVREAGAAGG